MNLIIVSSWCPFPADNGSRLRAYNLLRQLAARGHVLTLLALAQPETDAAQAISVLSELCAGGVKLFAAPHSSRRAAAHAPPRRGPRSVLLSWNADMAGAVHAAVQSGAYDRALFLEPGVLPYAPARPAVPCILDCMEVSRFLRQTRTVRVQLMLWKLRRYLQTHAPRFCAWTAVSEQERDAIRAFVGTPTPPLYVVPNGVDLEHNAFRGNGPADADRLVLNGAPDFVPKCRGRGVVCVRSTAHYSARRGSVPISG